MARRQRKPRPAARFSEAVLNDPLDDLFEKGVMEHPASADPWAAEEVVPEEVEAGQPNLLKTSEAALAFMLAGNARVTFKSKATGNRFTYRVRASEDGNVHFVALLNGSDNNTDYAYLGYIRRGVFFHGGAKAKVAATASSAKAFKWVWEQLQLGHQPGNVLEIWHEGRCGRCGRTLTVPSSIASGIGPECASKMEGM